MELQSSVRLPDHELESSLLDPRWPTLVVFTAKWCGPCRLMKPIVAELEQEFQHQVRVMVIDIEEYPKVSDRFRVLNLPTFLLFRQGKQTNRMKGMLDKQVLAKALKQL